MSVKTVRQGLQDIVLRSMGLTRCINEMTKLKDEAFFRVDCNYIVLFWYSLTEPQHRGNGRWRWLIVAFLAPILSMSMSMLTLMTPLQLSEAASRVQRADPRGDWWRMVSAGLMLSAKVRS